MEYKICPNCKTANKKMAKTCIKCGVDLKTSDIMQDNKSKNKKFKISLPIICIAAFVIILILGVIYESSEKGHDAVITLIMSILCASFIISIIETEIRKRKSVEYQELLQEKKRKKQEKSEIIAKYKKEGVKFCPYCLSTDFQYAGRQTIGASDAKTKTQYSLNLNPLKPFTFVNSKEKVVKKANSGYSYDEFICLKCGKRFR